MVKGILVRERRGRAHLSIEIHLNFHFFSSGLSKPRVDS